jgi:hypothetical protein
MRGKKKTNNPRNEYARNWYQQNKERLLRRMKERRAVDKDAWRVKQRRSLLKTKYGMTAADYAAMIEQQGGRCAICTKQYPLIGRDGRHSLHVDHDHATGKVRGLLCSGCNTFLGKMEKTDLVAAALIYLSENK